MIKKDHWKTGESEHNTASGEICARAFDALLQADALCTFVIKNNSTEKGEESRVWKLPSIF